MKGHIGSHIRKQLRYFGIPVLIASCPLSGCMVPPPKPALTQLQFRQLQTRTYENRDSKQVMKAVINALQDQGFIIRNADKELGFVTASKENSVGARPFGPSVFMGGVFGPPQDMRYDTAVLLEASVNVSEFGKETKVRVVFQERVSDNFGAASSARQIENSAFYQEFFYKVDKSLFYEREGI